MTTLKAAYSGDAFQPCLDEIEITVLDDILLPPFNVYKKTRGVFAMKRIASRQQCSFGDTSGAKKRLCSNCLDWDHTSTNCPYNRLTERCRLFLVQQRIIRTRAIANSNLVEQRHVTSSSAPGSSAISSNDEQTMSSSSSSLLTATMSSDISMANSAESSTEGQYSYNDVTNALDTWENSIGTIPFDT